MCGIAGQVALTPDGSIDPEQVRAMTRALLHRGPDDEGYYFDPTKTVGLGSRRLAIIDLVSGQQPVFNEDRSVACVFNGEIYNFERLRAGLERKGYRFRSASDSEVIAHLYEETGTACLDQLRGMFAIALWDGRRRTLLLARDRVGKKPLYYVQSGGRLSFASELPALLALPDLDTQVDPVALDLYLTYSYIPAPYSVYRAVRKLPPAHVMTVAGGSVTTRRYWQLAPGTPWQASRAELRARLREKLTEAVRIRMVSDVPLGCFLSGGVDSSTVVALMAGLSETPVKTFSVGFVAEAFSELGYARTLASHCRTEHYEFVVEPDAAAVLPEMVRHFGEPFGDSSALPVWYVSQLARKHVTVALNGDGGDELFGGYPSYQTALRLDRLSRDLPKPVRAALAAVPAWRSVPQAPKLRRLGARLEMTPAERFTSLRQSLSPEVKARLYSGTFLTSKTAYAEEYLQSYYDSATVGDLLPRLQYTDIMTYLPEDLLVKVDRMTMAHSLEGRSPLLDHELLEFALRLPADLKVAGRATKILLREAVEDLVPPGFLDRPKMGFSIPLATWLRRDLRDLTQRKVGLGLLHDSGWFQSEALRALLQEHVSGVRDRGTELWNLLVLAYWMEGFPS